LATTTWRLSGPGRRRERTRMSGAGRRTEAGHSPLPRSGSCPSCTPYMPGPLAWGCALAAPTQPSQPRHSRQPSLLLSSVVCLLVCLIRSTSHFMNTGRNYYLKTIVLETTLTTLNTIFPILVVLLFWPAPVIDNQFRLGESLHTCYMPKCVILYDVEVDTQRGITFWMG
jgi:hypothetical protein